MRKLGPVCLTLFLGVFSLNQLWRALMFGVVLPLCRKNRHIHCEDVVQALQPITFYLWTCIYIALFAVSFLGGVAVLAQPRDKSR
jgi:hypothetical protein